MRSSPTPATAWSRSTSRPRRVPAEVDRLAALHDEHAVVSGKLKAVKKLGAPDGALKAEAKRLKAAIAYAETAGLDPHRARVRLLQLYGGGRRVAVIDLDRVGVGILTRLDGATIMAHNAQFELSFLAKAGVEPGGDALHDASLPADLGRRIG